MALTAKQVGGVTTWQADGGTDVEVLQALLNRATELRALGWVVEEFYLVVKSERPTALMRAIFKGVEAQHGRWRDNGQPTGGASSPPHPTISDGG